MEIVKLRVRPKNGDRRLRSLVFSFDCSVDMKLVREHLFELFPFGYWLDEDKIQRFIVDFTFKSFGFVENCSHAYLSQYLIDTRVLSSNDVVK